MKQGWKVCVHSVRADEHLHACVYVCLGAGKLRMRPNYCTNTPRFSKPIETPCVDHNFQTPATFLLTRAAAATAAGSGGGRGKSREWGVKDETAICKLHRRFPGISHACHSLTMATVAWHAKSASRQICVPALSLAKTTNYTSVKRQKPSMQFPDPTKHMLSIWGYETVNSVSMCMDQYWFLFSVS